MACILQSLFGSDPEAFVIPPGPVKISVGRSGENDLRVDHISVSARHAFLERNGGGDYTLTDQNSSNGTFVNGERVSEKILHSGDLVRFASSEFRFLDESSIGNGGDEIATAPVISKNSEDKASDTESEFAALNKQVSELESELSTNAQKLVEEERKTEALSRELDSEREKESRFKSELSELRAKNLDLEGQLAAIQFELSRDRTERDRLKTEREEASLALGRLEEEKENLGIRIGELDNELDASRRQVQSLVSQGEEESLSARNLADQFLDDLRFWIDREKVNEDGESGLARLEAIRESIRNELAKVEPVWAEFGEGAQEELKRRLNDLKLEQRSLIEENREKLEVLSKTETELREIREKVDDEIRRAQGLSRRGTKVQLPEGYETMVIAKDREQAIYESLISDIEYFEALLTGYRKNRKLREVVDELEDFRKRLAKILSDQGVEEFEIPVGTMLTLKQRREVQILGKKGWGTREFLEQPFQPGEVSRVIRTGYRVGGEDGQGVILRKVEVLIREAGE